MKKYAFGVDLGGTTVKLGFFEATGELLETWEIPTRTQEGGKYILSDIADSINAKIDEKNIDKEIIVGVGLGVPGPVTPDGTVLKCVNLGWGIFNVEKELSELVGLKVKAGNDANIAALGEMWLGGGKGHKDLVMLTLGTGVGGGIIIGEKIIYGDVGAAGELGHMPMVPDEEDSCNCGKKGCLEQYTSATGIVRVTRKYIESHPDEKTCLKAGASAKEIFDAAKAGDEVALKMVDKLGEMLGRGCAMIACVVNPEVFVFGGGVSKAGQILLDAIEKHFKTYAFHASRDTTLFKAATLGNNAGIYGGVKLVLD